MKKSTTKNNERGSKSKSSSSTSGQIKPKSNAADGLRELFIHGLKDIYWAEKALVKALPKMSKNADSESLVTAIEDHITVTEAQVRKVETIFELLGENAVAKKCAAMEGLIKEGEDIVHDSAPGAVRDAGIIGASQKIEHYEIATYGTLCAYAKTLEEDEVADILAELLNEEKEADMVLTDTAYNDINFEAAQSDIEA